MHFSKLCAARSKCAIRLDVKMLGEPAANLDVVVHHFLGGITTDSAQAAPASTRSPQALNARRAERLDGALELWDARRTVGFAVPPAVRQVAPSLR